MRRRNKLPLSSQLLHQLGRSNTVRCPLRSEFLALPNIKIVQLQLYIYCKLYANDKTLKYMSLCVFSDLLQSPANPLSLNLRKQRWSLRSPKKTPALLRHSHYTPPLTPALILRWETVYGCLCMRNPSWADSACRLKNQFSHNGICEITSSSSSSLWVFVTGYLDISGFGEGSA